MFWIYSAQRRLTVQLTVALFQSGFWKIVLNLKTWTGTKYILTSVDTIFLPIILWDILFSVCCDVLIVPFLVAIRNYNIWCLIYVKINEFADLFWMALALPMPSYMGYMLEFVFNWILISSLHQGLYNLITQH